ncbi:MAG: hypothetical protein WBP12_00745 [Candidatus Saccharimonas sp.]
MVAMILFLLVFSVISFSVVRDTYRDAMKQKDASSTPVEPSNWYGRAIKPSTTKSLERPWLGPEDDPKWETISEEIIASL